MTAPTNPPQPQNGQSPPAPPQPQPQVTQPAPLPPLVQSQGISDPERDGLVEDIKVLREKLKTAALADQVSLRAAITECGKLLAERDKIAVEREKVDLERRKADQEDAKVALEQKKANWTAAGVVGSFFTVLIAVLTIGSQLKIANDQAKEQWDLKAADLLFASEDGAQFDLRLATLKSLFPDRSQRLAQFALTQNDETQRLRKKGILLRMIAAHPDQTKAVLSVWHALYGGDKWIADVQKQTENSDAMAFPDTPTGGPEDDPTGGPEAVRKTPSSKERKPTQKAHSTLGDPHVKSGGNSDSKGGIFKD